MDTETCEVLPLGYLDGTLDSKEVYSLALSGAIPACYVRDSARDTLGTAFTSGAVASALAVMVVYSHVLTHIL